MTYRAGVDAPPPAGRENGQKERGPQWEDIKYLLNRVFWGDKKDNGYSKQRCVITIICG